MEITLQIPEYDNKTGLLYHWENGFEINISNINSQILICANKEALISLAVQLLTLAQAPVPVGSHMHYDEYNSLEQGSTTLVIEKVN